MSTSEVRSRAHRRASKLAQSFSLSLALGLALACAMTPERLPELDRRFYYNLPTPDDQKEFLQLAESERQDYLEKKGLWKKWLALPKKEREAAGEGRVELGFDEFTAFMAWGPPADTQTQDEAGRPAILHTFIRCSSGPSAGRYVRNNLDCDGTSSETQIAVVDGKISEIKYPN